MEQRYLDMPWNINIGTFMGIENIEMVSVYVRL